MKNLRLKTKQSNYEIDQSGKIEQTNKPTIIAIANGKVATIKISAVEKQKLIKTITELRKPNKTYAYDIFSALIYLLLTYISPVEVEIDKEYPGHEAGIKERILQFFERTSTQNPEIYFGLVGKKSNAHIEALAVFQRKKKATFTVKAKDILKVLYVKPNKKGWRSRSSRENP